VTATATATTTWVVWYFIAAASLALGAWVLLH
jgi:hypothetical protein